MGQRITEWSFASNDKENLRNLFFKIAQTTLTIFASSTSIYYNNSKKCFPKINLLTKQSFDKNQEICYTLNFFN